MSAQELRFCSHDGVELFYRHWPAMQPRRGAILLLHRGHEHSGRMAHLVEELQLPEFDVYAWDARGHGRSPGLRGHSPSVACSVHDLHCFADHIRDRHGVNVSDLVVLAQSVGAVLASVWVHDYAPPIRALLLAAPAFAVKLYVPLARPALAFWYGLRGNFFVNSYVKAKLLTHDRARQYSYDSDPLIARAIAVNILLELHQAAARVVADAQAITVPTMVLISGADWVVEAQPQHDFFARLGASIKQKLVLPGFYHDTLGESGRAPVLADIRRFIQQRYQYPNIPTDLRDADQRGASHAEAQALARPLPWHTPAAWRWKLSRLAIRAGAQFAQGLRLGRQTGFDSGAMLDYVYCNRAQGLGPLGRFIDRQYLNAVGWRGIRQRKVHIEELLAQSMARLRQAGHAVNIVDLAAGHGRYVLDTVRQQAIRPDSVLLRDFSGANSAAAQALIEQWGLRAWVRCEQGDAFAAELNLPPATSVAIISGLFELFPDNAPVSQTLSNLAASMANGGYLIYTNQPWHPQLEFIARCLTSHRNGQAWVMRRRCQQEMDQLVSAAGFDKIDQRIDTWGIFTVSLARRRHDPQ